MSALFIGCHAEEPADILKKAASGLTAEFDGSYPGDVKPRPGIREYDLVAAPAVVQMFDGRPLHAWAYNGQVPGPILRVSVGELIRVRLTNRLRKTPQSTGNACASPAPWMVRLS